MGMIDLGIKVQAIVGHYGVYLAYYFAGFSHIRLMGNLAEDLSPDEDPLGWAVFPADPDDWLMWAVLRVQTWETATDCFFTAVFPGRIEAWKIARAKEGSRKTSTIYNEYYIDNHWHVACLTPKGKA